LTPKIDERNCLDAFLIRALHLFQEIRQISFSILADFGRTNLLQK